MRYFLIFAGLLICFNAFAQIEYNTTTDTLTVSRPAKLIGILVGTASTSDTLRIFSTNAETTAYEVAALVCSPVGWYPLSFYSPTGIYIRRVGTAAKVTYIYE